MPYRTVRLEVDENEDDEDEKIREGRDEGDEERGGGGEQSRRYVHKEEKIYNNEKAVRIDCITNGDYFANINVQSKLL